MSGAFWRAKRAAWQAAQFDRKYRTDTIRQLPVAAMTNVPQSLAAHAVHYEASAIPKVKRALTFLQRSLASSLELYSFVDFGSGKGLVAMLASSYPFRRVFGVEMSPELHLVAESNVRKYAAMNPRCAPITLSCANALTYEFPAGDFVAYLYNPFDAHLMQQFVARLAAAAHRESELLIVYVNPVHRASFDLDARFRNVYDDGTLCVYRVVFAHVGKDRPSTQIVATEVDAPP